MKCWHCNTELIWGGDHDLDEHDYRGVGAYDMITNLSCPNCQAYVEVYHPKLDHPDHKDEKNDETL